MVLDKKGASRKLEKKGCYKKEEKERITELKKAEALLEKIERKDKKLGEIIRKKCRKFFSERNILREIRYLEKKHGKERRENILPNEGFGD